MNMIRQTVALLVMLVSDHFSAGSCWLHRISNWLVQSEFVVRVNLALSTVNVKWHLLGYWQSVLMWNVVYGFYDCIIFYQQIFTNEISNTIF